jgi:hypothetical protein
MDKENDLSQSDRRQLFKTMICLWQVMLDLKENTLCIVIVNCQPVTELVVTTLFTRHTRHSNIAGKSIIVRLCLNIFSICQNRAKYMIFCYLIEIIYHYTISKFEDDTMKTGFLAANFVSILADFDIMTGTWPCTLGAYCFLLQPDTIMN